MARLSDVLEVHAPHSIPCQRITTVLPTKHLFGHGGP